jgi:tRNA A37 threonylcarbamoyladenosine dehydratase
MSSSVANNAPDPTASGIDDTDYARRFGGVARLYGAPALARFEGAHVCVIGIGGVGSWAVEALARNAIGTLTLIDLDHIAPSNTNRQIHALGDAYGQAKVEAMAARVRAINPRCTVHAVDDFLTVENIGTLLGDHLDYVIDAIDAVAVKTVLIAHCRRHKLPLITCGSAGGQLDPTRVRVVDLSRTVQDPMLAKVRGNLRRHYGFARNPKRKFGIDAVYSDEPLQYPDAAPAHDGDDENDVVPAAAPQGLACAGFGSSVCVTSTFGMAAAATALRALAGLGQPALADELQE